MSNNLGDNYDTHPFDLEYLLKRWAVRQSDVIWDPFINNGASQRTIAKLGYTQYQGREDVMQLEQAPPEVTLIVTNPPFSKKDLVLQKLVKFNVPFVLLLPTNTIQRDYFSRTVSSCQRHWEVILPNKSLRFHSNGAVQPAPIFKCCYVFSSPAIGQQALDLTRIENVSVSMFDLAQYRKTHNFSTKDFNTEI